MRGKRTGSSPCSRISDHAVIKEPLNQSFPDIKTIGHQKIRITKIRNFKSPDIKKDSRIERLSFFQSPLLILLPEDQAGTGSGPLPTRISDRRNG